MPIGARQNTLTHGEDVLKKTGAVAAIVIVVGGNRGSGFSCHGDLKVLQELPRVLEDTARQIRESTLQ